MEFELSLTLRENGNELMPPAKWAGKMESNPSVQTLGLSLAQAKTLLTNLQTEIVEQQVTRMSNRQRRCLHCGLARKLKDFHEIHYGSLFGDVATRVPRWRSCGCNQNRQNVNHGNRQRWVSVELEFVQSQLAACIPYAKSSELLSMLLPATKASSISAMRRHTLATGRHLDRCGLVSEKPAIKRGAAAGATVVGVDGGYLGVDLFSLSKLTVGNLALA